MKTFKIDNILIPSRYLLAPMAGFSDYSLRKMSSDFGAGIVYSEMVSCESVIYNSKESFFDLKMTKEDKKNKNLLLALQIFGGKKESILKSIPVIEENAEYDFLDFNCGCPVNKVVRQNAGSKWLTRIDELIDLAKEIVKISKKPVTFKLRTGFNKEIDLISLAKNLELVGVKGLTIHGRLRKDFFIGDVNYDIIREVKENVKIPIIANGNIDTNNFMDVFKLTNADALMIGRKAIGNPRIFEDLINLEEGKKIKERTILDNINDLKTQIDLMYKYLDNKKASDILRGVSTHYIRNGNNVAKLRNKLVKCKSKEEYLRELDYYIQEYQNG